MTKTELNSKIDASYKNAIEKYANSQGLKDALVKHSDGNGQISTEQLSALVLSESILFSKELVRSILLEVLPFDD